MNDSTPPIVGSFYRFSFDLINGYEVISVNTTDTPDEINVSIIATVPAGEGCEFFMQCGRYRGCRTGEEITINITAPSPSLMFDLEDFASSKCLNLGGLYEITGSDYLEYQKWECLGPVFCDEEPVLDVPSNNITITDLECTDCLIGNQYYKLTDCETQEEKYVYVENNTTLFPEKVYVFKEEPLVGYTAELQEQTCPVLGSTVTVYTADDILDVYENCEEYTKTCYSLTDCQTGSVTITSDPEMEKYVGIKVKWVNLDDEDLIERCALVEAFNCRSERYVDVTGLDYTECNNGIDNIIYIDKLEIIAAKEAEKAGSAGTNWLYVGDVQCVMQFERTTLELTPSGSVIDVEQTFIQGLHGTAFVNPNIQFLQCYDECEDCLIINYDDCVTEEDLSLTSPSCFTFNELCNDSYSNLLTLVSNGSIEDVTLQEVLSEVKLQTPEVISNVLDLLGFYLRDEEKCLNTITTDQVELDNRIAGLQFIYPDEPLYTYYTNIYNLATEVLSNLEPLLVAYIDQYDLWELNGFNNTYRPDIFSKFRFNYINKSGLSLDVEMSKQFNFLRLTNKPYYFTNEDYVGTKNYHDLISKKIDITKGRCI